MESVSIQDVRLARADADILYDTLKHNLSAFDRFKDYIYRYMQAK